MTLTRIKSNTVKFRGKKYDTKTTYCWTDPDFPDDASVRDAMSVAKKAGDNPDKDWPDHVKWEDAEYTFKCSGFMKSNGDIDCLPAGVALGRITVSELKKYPNECYDSLQNGVCVRMGMFLVPFTKNGIRQKRCVVARNLGFAYYKVFDVFGRRSGTPVHVDRGKRVRKCPPNIEVLRVRVKRK